MAAHRDHGHRLGAASHDYFRATAHNALGGHGDGLQSRRAESVDRHGRHFYGQASAQGSDAGYVHALFGFGHGTAENHVLDLFGIELRNTLEGSFDRYGSEFVGASGAESAFERPSNRCANRGSNDDFTHMNLRSLHSMRSTVRQLRASLHWREKVIVRGVLALGLLVFVRFIAAVVGGFAAMGVHALNGRHIG